MAWLIRRWWRNRTNRAAVRLLLRVAARLDGERDICIHHAALLADTPVGGKPLIERAAIYTRISDIIHEEVDKEVKYDYSDAELPLGQRDTTHHR